MRRLMKLLPAFMAQSGRSGAPVTAIEKFEAMTPPEPKRARRDPHPMDKHRPSVRGRRAYPAARVEVDGETYDIVHGLVPTVYHRRTKTIQTADGGTEVRRLNTKRVRDVRVIARVLGSWKTKLAMRGRAA